jgi:hypothetical protein
VKFGQSIAETETLRAGFHRRDTSYWFYKNAVVFRGWRAIGPHGEPPSALSGRIDAARPVSRACPPYRGGRET